MTEEQKNKHRKENNGMFGKSRPDLARSNKDPALKKKRSASYSKTMRLRRIIEVGFGSEEDFVDFWKNKDLTQMYIKDVIATHLIDFKGPRSVVSKLLDFFGIIYKKKPVSNITGRNGRPLTINV